MQQLSSRNYKFVDVRFRGDEETPFTMPRNTGDNLMKYLATPNAPSKHVILTDVLDYKKTVHTSEIISATPVYEGPALDESVYRNLAELKADRKPTTQIDMQEVPDEVRQHRLEVIRKMKEEFIKKRTGKS